MVALIIGAAYLAYSMNYWSSANTGTGSSAEQIGAGLATALVIPHLVMTGLGALFNLFALLMYSRPFALTAAILYTVALVLFPMYFMFVILQMILCYVAFARMEKKKDS